MCWQKCGCWREMSRLKKLPPEVQQDVVRTLGQIGEGTDAKRLVQIAREPDNHWAAVAQLIEQRRYWPALYKAIERGEAEANWLTTVAIRQGLIFVVEGRGGLSYSTRGKSGQVVEHCAKRIIVGRRDQHRSHRVGDDALQHKVASIVRNLATTSRPKRPRTGVAVSISAASGTRNHPQ